MTRHKIMTVFPWMPFEKSTVPVPYRTHDILGRLAAYFCFQIHHPHVWKFAGTVPVPVPLLVPYPPVLFHYFYKKLSHTYGNL